MAINFKDSFKYCLELGCDDDSISYCCPELMGELCLPKERLLNKLEDRNTLSETKSLIELSFSNDDYVRNTIDNIVENAINEGYEVYDEPDCEDDYMDDYDIDEDICPICGNYFCPCCGCDCLYDDMDYLD